MGTPSAVWVVRPDLAVESCLRAALTLVFLALFSGVPVSLQPIPTAARGRTSAETHSPMFSKVWTAADGLGPGANALSCVACHSMPYAGGSSVNPDAIVLLSEEATDPTGGHLFRRLTILPGRPVFKEPLPRKVFRRRPPPLFGLGLLELIPAADVAALSDPSDENRDGISGRVVTGNGRFGWKARFATLDRAVAAALVNELGLSSPAFPDDGRGDSSHPELSAERVRDLTDFVRMLPAPAARSPSKDSSGLPLFARLGCAQCHMPRLRLRDGRVVDAYTDLLVHDMGEALADGFSEGGAGSHEFRTTPLWGIGTTGPPFMHDGRAKTLDAAIRLHDGEARQSRIEYEHLHLNARRGLLAFLSSR